jgi:hypothetical protein
LISKFIKQHLERLLYRLLHADTTLEARSGSASMTATPYATRDLVYI